MKNSEQTPAPTPDSFIVAQTIATFTARTRVFCERNAMSPLTLGRKVLGSSYTLDQLDRAGARVAAKIAALSEAMDEIEPPARPTRLVFNLPIPTSTNDLHTHGKRGIFRSKEYRAWAKQAGQELMVQRSRQRMRGLPPGPYGVTIWVPFDDAGDIDNRVKALMDLLHSMSVTSDDRLLHDQRVLRSHLTPQGTCQVEVFTMAEGGADAA